MSDQNESIPSRIRRAIGDLYGDSIAEDSEIESIEGAASNRKYRRVSLPDQTEMSYRRAEQTLVAQVYPVSGNDAGDSEEGPPGSSEDEDLESFPFVDVQNYLEGVDVPVPEIDHVDLDEGLVLMEDLGDQSFEEEVHRVAEAGGTLEERKQNVGECYKEAIDLLVKLQAKALSTAVESNPKDQCVAFRRSFDREALRWELDHYLEWGLEAQHGKEQIDPYRDELDEQFDELADEIAQIPKTLSLRDYQSTNLMLKDDTWHIIDFQDALTAPYVYDLVALLRDSYVAPDPDQIPTLISHYERRGADLHLPWCSTDENIWRSFYMQTIQRKLKDAGRFVYIDRQKGDSSFMQYYDRSIRFVREALEQISGFERLEQMLYDVEPAMTGEGS